MIDYSDVGCWIVKANPKRWDYFAWLSEDTSPPVKPPHIYPNDWTLGNTYRNDMIREGDLIALWVTGPESPGIYEFGWVMSPKPYESDGFDPTYIEDSQDTGGLCQAIEFASVRLRDNFLPRSDMKTDSVLAGAEQFLAPQGSNPSYLTLGQAEALAHLLSLRVSPAAMRDADWHKLL